MELSHYIRQRFPVLIQSESVHATRQGIVAEALSADGILPDDITDIDTFEGGDNNALNDAFVKALGGADIALDSNSTKALIITNIDRCSLSSLRVISGHLRKCINYFDAEPSAIVIVCIARGECDSCIEPLVHRIHDNPEATSTTFFTECQTKLDEAFKQSVKTKNTQHLMNVTNSLVTSVMLPEDIIRFVERSAHHVNECTDIQSQHRIQVSVASALMNERLIKKLLIIIDWLVAQLVQIFTER